MTSLLVAGLVTACLASVVLRRLRTPLVALLIEACVLEHRVLFWWRVSAAGLLIGTAFCAATSLAVNGLARSEWEAGAAVVRGGCVGLLISLSAITAGTVAVGRGTTIASTPLAK